MNTEVIELKKLKCHKANPRLIKDYKFQSLINSLLVFPEMLELRPIVVDNKFEALGGNMRTKALLSISQMNDEEIAQRLNKLDGYKGKTAEQQSNLIQYWKVWRDKPIAHIVKADSLTDDQKREFMIKDNSSFGEWDMDALANEWNLEELNEWGLELNFGADVLSVEDEEEEPLEVVEDDFDEEIEDIEARCKVGDVWQLGEHRLMCGDSTSEETYQRLMQGEKAILCFTDPPYGMKKERGGVLNDNLNYDDLLDFNKKWIPLSFSNLVDNGSWYCWGIDEPLMDIYSGILRKWQKENKITFRNYITWAKHGAFGVGSNLMRCYPRETEKCLFVMKGQQKYGSDLTTWFEGFEVFRQMFVGELEKAGYTISTAIKITNNTAVGHYASKSQYAFPTKESWEALRDSCNGIAFKQDYEKVKQDYEKVKQEWYSTRAYFDNTHNDSTQFDIMTDVWRYSVTSNKERELCGGHATPKPIALCSRGIKSSSRENDVVLDCFGGSGSTLIACEQLNRKARLVELDPHYCDVIIARWEKFTGKQAVKISE